MRSRNIGSMESNYCFYITGLLRNQTDNKEEWLLKYVIKRQKFGLPINLSTQDWLVQWLPTQHFSIRHTSSHSKLVVYRQRHKNTRRSQWLTCGKWRSFMKPHSNGLLIVFFDIAAWRVNIATVLRVTRTEMTQMEKFITTPYANTMYSWSKTDIQKPIT